MTKQTQNKECCEKCANSSWLGLNGKCWHICHKLEPKPQEQNWEIEFNKRFCDKEGCQRNSKECGIKNEVSGDFECHICERWGGVEGTPKDWKRPLATSTEK